MTTAIPAKYVQIAASFVAGAGLGYLIAYLSSVQPSYIPLVSAVVGLLVAFASPIWQAFFVNAPKLSVEISAIKRTISEAAVIAVDEDPELAALLPARDPRFPPFYYAEPFGPGGRGAQRGQTLAETDELLVAAKQRLRDLPAQIEDRKRELEKVKAIKPSAFSKYEANQLNASIHPEVEFDPAAPEKTLEAFKENYAQRLAEFEKAFSNLQSNLPTAERKLEVLRRDLINNRSFFTVSASLINSGRTNTAIKVPALLRVSIGEGNYIDLKLTLKDFESKSEISANGTRIVVFESAEVSSLPEEDRKLINTYWGQSVASRLFLEDIHSKIYVSNGIAFAEGLYQKIIYDRLAREASSNNGRTGEA